MYPILGRYGPFLFYSYTALTGLGLLLSVGMVAWQIRHHPALSIQWLDGVVASLLLAMVTGRAGYVLANWDYFQSNIDESWRLWRGGLSYHAALFAGIASLALWCWHRRCSFSVYADLLAPAGALWSAFGWTACWLEGCAYGRETLLGLLSADLRDTFGVYAVRYQTQLGGLGFSLLALVLFWIWRRRLPAGAGFWLVLAVLSGGRALVSLYRGDLQPLLGLISVSTVVDATLTVLALAILILIYYRRSTWKLVAPQTKNLHQ